MEKSQRTLVGCVLQSWQEKTPLVSASFRSKSVFGWIWCAISRCTYIHSKYILWSWKIRNKPFLSQEPWQLETQGVFKLEKIRQSREWKWICSPGKTFISLPPLSNCQYKGWKKKKTTGELALLRACGRRFKTEGSSCFFSVHNYIAELLALWKPKV